MVQFPSVFAILAILVMWGQDQVSGKPVITAHATETVPIWWSTEALSGSATDDVDSFYLLDDISVPLQRSAVRNKANLWPGGIVPYVIEKNVSQAHTDLLLEAMREIEHNVGNSTHPCVQFIPRTTERNYIWIHVDRGCHSIVGFDNIGRQETALSESCMVKGVVMHEFLHTLGLFHEQDRYDRINYIDINKTNIEERGKRNFHLRNDSVIDTHNTPYDYASIMHYGAFNFADDKRRPVITTKSNDTTVWIGQRLGLSPLDVLRIQRMYECPEDASHLSSTGDLPNRLVWCDFGENDTCDLIVEKNDPLNITVWQVTSEAPTPDAPIAGYSNGQDWYFYIGKNSNDDGEASITKVSSDAGDSPGNQTDAPLTTATPKLTSPLTTVSLKTPLLVNDVDFFCVDVATFIPGPSTYFEYYCSGPQLPRQRFFSYKGLHPNRWSPARLSVTIPAGVQFQMELMVTLEEGSLSFDNFHIYKGVCK